ncbi:hypothetical protein DSM14862_03848 (plasmid) [Sulfitobacter indolifex]|nr:hypothetical protein DSM14862_03848 [Sulfitobacter indolifex]
MPNCLLSTGRSERQDSSPEVIDARLNEFEVTIKQLETWPSIFGKEEFRRAGAFVTLDR